MRSILSLPHAFRMGLALAMTLPCLPLVAGNAFAAKGKAAATPAAKKSSKEISSTDDALQKQMDWENKILGPTTEKKIDLAKIQKLQADETARREKQEKIDKVDRERKDRELAAKEAAQRNVKAAGSHEVPEIQEAPPPPKPAEKHDDAFVDKLMTGKNLPKKKAAATNDDVDELLRAAKQEKPTQVAGKSKGGDGVDALLATADKQPTIKTTTKRPTASDEPVSAEAASREAAMKAIAAASAKADEERNRNKRPAIPDAAILRARAEANARANPPSPMRSASASASSSKPGWNDPFAAEAESPVSSKRGKVSATVRPPAPELEPAPAPSKRGGRSGAAGWKDPFDAGDSAPARSRPAPAKAAPAGKSKHPANWKDPFA